MYTYLRANEYVYNRRIHAQLPLHTSVLIYHTTVHTILSVCTLDLGGPPPGFMVSSYLPTYTSRYVRARCASRTLCFSHFVLLALCVRGEWSAGVREREWVVPWLWD